MTKLNSADASRYADGWRRGKPEEDPEKTKRWGWVSARPSEFLLRMRGGQVAAAGQGVTVFKWPWDSIAIVPTTVQRLHFVADQITQEKVGVKVTGIAVYRVAEPIIAARMLNFSYPERAQEKLAEMMEEMCVGASRRLIANLSVEQVLTQRKDALARELVHEIAPVVGGEGRREDSTQRGWGVVVDTIEIQDVRVLSAQVFGNMQARFRVQQEQLAREAELAKERALKTDEAKTQREIQLLRIATATELRRNKQAAEEAALLEKLQTETRLKQEQWRAAVEELQLKAHALRLQADAAEAKRSLTEIEARTVELEVHKQQLLQEPALQRAARLKEIENALSPEAIQLAVANRLPELAAAFQQNMGEVHVTAVDGANPFGYIAAAVEGVMGLARSAGLDVKKP